MGVLGVGCDCYLYVNGLAVSTPITLHDNVCLCPAKFGSKWDEISELFKNDIDFSMAVLAHSSIGSQLHITAGNSRELATCAWNALWDCILVGALFDCDVMCNLQSDQQVENLAKAKYVNIINYAFHALLSNPYTISAADEAWLIKYYEPAHRLMDNEAFSTAVHAMASYRWHSFPRIQLAIIWSGIEALFNISTEVSFRISLYIANFLGENQDDAKLLFQTVKKMYSLRSSAVHGNKMKDDTASVVIESARLFNRIIRRCAEINSLPKVDNLIFNETVSRV